ncbi:hypothetical protein [Aliiroseovarius sp.]|uniref:hypothetical protein n=1 Tax=Aliiroseovarius sp. TaxID=1872442 RepID=UPI003BAC0D17
MSQILTQIAHKMITRAERRLGVALDYVHQIADTDIGLLTRYNRLFGFLDPVKHVPKEAYHVARLRGALAADCGTCVEAEVNLARKAKLSDALIRDTLHGVSLPAPLCHIATLADAVTRDRVDAPDARAAILDTYGEKGLIELSFAMNGAALLPGIKRAMGHATACDLSLMKRLG